MMQLSERHFLPQLTIGSFSSLCFHNHTINFCHTSFYFCHRSLVSQVVYLLSQTVVFSSQLVYICSQLVCCRNSLFFHNSLLFPPLVCLSQHIAVFCTPLVYSQLLGMNGFGQIVEMSGLGNTPQPFASPSAARPMCPLPIDCCCCL